MTSAVWVDLTAELSARMHDIAQRYAMGPVDVISQVFALYDIVQAELAKGHRLVCVDEHGSVVREIVQIC